MFVPFITKRSAKNLERRRGGGAKGGGSSGGGGKSGGGGGGTSGGGSGRSGGTARSSPIGNSAGTSRSATSYGGGTSKVSSIPSGSLFAGRSVGGGTRNDVVGTRTYGSGYPGTVGQRGVAGLGFPFFFWPLAWGGLAGAGGAAYLHNREYGRPDNSSRPGGVMMTAAFTSSSSPTTFRLLADNTTVQALIQDIVTNCTSSNLASPESIVAITYNDTDTTPPLPEQVVQYYRASSVALSLDGYNDTSALSESGGPDIPLPTNIDTTLLNCLNQTISVAVPLVDGSLRWTPPPTTGLLGLAYLVWSLSSLL